MIALLGQVQIKDEHWPELGVAHFIHQHTKSDLYYQINLTLARRVLRMNTGPNLM